LHRFSKASSQNQGSSLPATDADTTNNQAKNQTKSTIMNTLKKIVALGDSITKGVIYDGESYKILPTGFVSQCADNFQADIDNYGRMGCTVTRGTQIAEQHAEAIAGSDVTLVEFGGNDSDFCWTDIASAPADAHYPMTELPTFRSIYRNLIERIRKLGSKPVLMTLPLIDDKRFYNFVTRNMGERGRNNVLSWLGGQQERIRNYHDMYSLAVYQIGYQERVPVLDITSPFLHNRDYLPYLCCDGIHPSQEGHNLIAESVTAQLYKILPQL
jgi:lysophospholipase L1-like esterase